MAYSIIILTPVYTEVNEAFLYFESQSPGLGEKFYKAFLSCLQKLEINPFYFSFYSENYRRITFQKFPYIILYKISEDKNVIITSVVYGGRHPDLISKRISER